MTIGIAVLRVFLLSTERSSQARVGEGAYPRRWVCNTPDGVHPLLDSRRDMKVLRELNAPKDPKNRRRKDLVGRLREEERSSL